MLFDDPRPCKVTNIKAKKTFEAFCYGFTTIDGRIRAVLEVFGECSCYPVDDYTIKFSDIQKRSG